MMKKNVIFPLLLLLLTASIIGFFVEYLRLENVCRDYLVYETRVETGLMARLASGFLERNDQAGFEHLCHESARYSDGAPPKPSLPAAERNEKSDQKKLPNADPAAGPVQIPEEDRPSGLLSRVTLFDGSGRVLFDSWEDAARMENHADRPEFRKIMSRLADEAFPFAVFERYSTTVQKPMFFCITRFQVGGETFLLRLGNTLQSIQAVDSVYRRDLSLIFLFGSAAVLLLLMSFASQWSQYRRKIFDLNRVCSEPSVADSSSPSVPKRVPGIDGLLRSIKGEFDSRNTLLSRERHLRDMIFQSLLEGIVLVDKNGRVIDINNHACRLLGTETKFLRGASLFALWRNPDLPPLFQRCVADRSETAVIGEELTLENPDGPRRLDVRIRPIHWGEGKSDSAFLFLLYDLTTIRRLENYRREFVSNVSHELKTPLTVIMGSVEALEDGAFTDASLAPFFLSTLSTHSRRLYALVQDVLTLSQLEADDTVRRADFSEGSLADIAITAAALCRPQALKNGIELRTENDAKQDTLPLNAGLMEQAVVNLIDNAVKYSASAANSADGSSEKKEKSSGMIETDGIDESPKTEGSMSGMDELRPRNESSKNGIRKRVILRLANPDAETITLEVSDEGPGIPPAHLARIFERFYRVDPSRNHKTGGTGLGLAIVKHVVQLHGGNVTVQNHPDRGCSFTIRLPIPPKSV